MRKCILAAFLFIFSLSAYPSHCKEIFPLGTITEDQAREMIDKLDSNEGVPGIYTLQKAGYKGRFLVLPNDTEYRPKARYISVILSSTNSNDSVGRVKFFLTPTSEKNTYDAEYYDYGDLAVVKKTFTANTLQDQIIIDPYPLHRVKNQFIKVYP